MKDLILTILLISLVGSIIFHALSSRYDLVRIDDTAAMRIDRLTGRVAICGVSISSGAACHQIINEKQLR